MAAEQQSEGRIETPANNAVAASDNFDRAELYEGVAALSSNDCFGSDSTRGGAGANTNDGTLSGNSVTDQQGALDRGMSQTESLYGGGSRGSTDSQFGVTDGPTNGVNGSEIPGGSDNARSSLGSDAKTGRPPEFHGQGPAAPGVSGERSMNGSVTGAAEQAAIQDGLSRESTQSLYQEQSVSQITGRPPGGTAQADAVTGQQGEALSAASRGGESEVSLQSDLRSTEMQTSTDAKGDRLEAGPNALSDRASPPEVRLPTPEQILTTPIEQLRADSQASRAALENYVTENAASIPPLAMHGTTKEGIEGITANPNSPLYVACSHPDRLAQGGGQYLSDLGKSVETGMSFASKWADQRQAGGVMVFNTSNVPKVWAGATEYSSEAKTGGPGTLPGALGMKGDLDFPGEAHLLGVIPPHADQPINELYGALNQEYVSQSGKPSPEVAADLNARADVVNELKRLHLAREALSLLPPGQAAGSDVLPGSVDAAQMHGVGSNGRQNERDESPRGLKKYVPWLF